MTEAPEHKWPDTLRLRDTRLHDDLGGGGQRIYTTAGQGYERREYTRTDLLDARIAEAVAREREAIATELTVNWGHIATPEMVAAIRARQP